MFFILTHKITFHFYILSLTLSEVKNKFIALLKVIKNEQYRIAQCTIIYPHTTTHKQLNFITSHTCNTLTLEAKIIMGSAFSNILYELLQWYKITEMRCTTQKPKQLFPAPIHHKVSNCYVHIASVAIKTLAIHMVVVHYATQSIYERCTIGVPFC